jgi:hypothetical protein
MKGCGQVLVDGVDERRRAIREDDHGFASNCVFEPLFELGVADRVVHPRVGTLTVPQAVEEEGAGLLILSGDDGERYRWSSASKAVRVMMPPSRWDFRWA